jgi:hypothetical protein
MFWRAGIPLERGLRETYDFFLAQSDNALRVK